MGDYGRSLAGLAVTLGLIFLGNPVPGVTAVLAGLAAIFLVYGMRTLRRSLTRIWLDEMGIRCEGWQRGAIRWNELKELSVRYFSTRRDSSGGWMQLRLSGSGQVISIESSLVGFAEVVRHAVNVAQSRGLALAAATRENLKALGIRPGKDAS